MAHRQSRVLNCVDMRHDNAERSPIERARSDIPLTRRNPNDRRDVVVHRGDGDLRHRFEGERAVLQIDEEPIEVACPHHFGDLDAARETHADSER
jgi:hypothetical protein